VPKNITQELIEEWVLKFFVSGNIPLLQVENEHLRALISLIKLNGKNAHAPGHTTLCTRVSQYSKMGMEKLKSVLQANDSKISLALDCWSSRSNYGFLGTRTISYYYLGL
jgi:hypothetical protein